MKMTTTAIPAIRIAGTLFAGLMLAGVGVAHAQTPPSAAHPPAQKKAAANAPAAPAPATPANAAAPSNLATNVIVHANGAELTAEEVRAYLSGLNGQQQAAMVQNPALLNQTVKLLLANRLVEQEIATKKWDQQPAIG